MLDLKPLWELQTMIKEETQTQRELKKLPQVGRLRELKEQIQELQIVLQRQRDIDTKLAAQIKKLEQQIEGLKEKSRETSDKLYGGEITKVKEMESANLQIEKMQQDITGMENELIKLMEDKEELQNNLSSLKENFAAVKSEYMKLMGSYQAQKENLQQKLATYPARKQAIRQQIDADLITVFENLQKKYPLDAIIRIQQSICGGCHMRISFDLQKKLKNADELIYCDNCGRIIFID